MKIKTMPLGLFEANCYLLSDSKVCVVIDPAEDAPVLSYLAEQGLTLGAILLTHGHFDHVWGVAALKAATGAPVYCHAADVELLRHPNLAAGAFGQIPCPPCDADAAVKDGGTLTVGEMTFTFLHTPGHSKGSVVIVCGDHWFTGDTLFAGSVGRTDLYGGDMEILMQSLAALCGRAGTDPSEITIYPGHGNPSNLAEECRYNPYLRRSNARREGADE